MTDFLVIAGTYERLLYGLSGDSNNQSLAPAFIYPAHISCITALDATKRFLATGSTDEHVKLYDLKIRKEIGTLMHHSGTITALRFIGNQHLITGSQDGTIGIVRTSDWEHLKSLTGHNGPILAFDAHPSGKVLLSVGKDQTLKCWDLSRAVCSFSMKLSQVPTKVYWSNDGTHFAVFFDKLIQIHCLETGEIVAKLQQQNRINSGTFVTLTMDNLEHQVLVFGGEDKILRILNLKGELIASWMSGHEYRIKDMAFLESTTLLSTCSSDGTVFVWDLQKCIDTLKDEETALVKPQIATYDAKCRLTCIALVHPHTYKKKVVEIEKQVYPESDYEDMEPKSKISVSFDINAPLKDQDSKPKQKKKPNSKFTTLVNKKGKPFKVQKKKKPDSN